MMWIVCCAPWAAMNWHKKHSKRSKKLTTHRKLHSKKKGSSVDDFDEDFVVAPDVNQLASLEAQINMAVELIKEIETHEDFIKAKRQELNELTNKTIPDAMAAAGVQSFKTNAGVKVDVKEFISGSLPKDGDARANAFQWLEANGASGLIKGTITAEFPKGDDNARARNQAAEALSGLGIDFAEQETVHASTLQAYARERLRSGEDVPFELLGLYAGRTAKISVPK